MELVFCGKITLHQKIRKCQILFEKTKNNKKNKLITVIVTVKIRLHINCILKLKQIYNKNNLPKNKNNSSKNKNHQESKSSSDLCSGLLQDSPIVF